MTDQPHSGPNIPLPSWSWLDRQGRLSIHYPEHSLDYIELQSFMRHVANTSQFANEAGRVFVECSESIRSAFFELQKYIMEAYANPEEVRRISHLDEFTRCKEFGSMSMAAFFLGTLTGPLDVQATDVFHPTFTFEQVGLPHLQLGCLGRSVYSITDPLIEYFGMSLEISSPFLDSDTTLAFFDEETLNRYVQSMDPDTQVELVRRFVADEIVPTIMFMIEEEVVTNVPPHVREHFLNIIRTNWAPTRPRLGSFNIDPAGMKHHQFN